MTEKQKQDQRMTEDRAKAGIFGMNAGAGTMIGSIFGHPITGLIGGCLTGNLMNRAGRKTNK